MERSSVKIALPLGFILVAGMILHPIMRANTSSHVLFAEPMTTLHTSRTASTDLEIGGDLAGASTGSTLYLTREDLLALPQTAFTVANDANFSGATMVSGVGLESLTQLLAANPKADMVVAICDDKYDANYPRAYMTTHDPLLVLTVNGNPPARWPKAPEDGSDMGPYLISNPAFEPSFKVLSHAEEPQIPWGVVRIEFREESEVFGAIAPRGSQARDEQVQAGYRIAEQNCLRCHNMGREGGLKAGRSWQILSAWATSSPEYFAAYVRNPQSKNRKAQMPGNPSYDDATLKALSTYFQTFSPGEKQ